MSGPVLSAEDFAFFSSALHERTRIFLAPSKRELLQSRLSGRLRDLQLTTWSAYRERLAHAPSGDPEWQIFINAMTTNKTDFFREPEHFRILVDRFVPEFRARKGKTARLRIWSAACSTGEEPYSLAMALLEVPGLDFEILASDLDTSVIALAKNGVYPRDRVEAQIPKALLRKHVRFGTGDISNWARMSDAVKAKIRFQQHNLMRPLAQETAFDIIFCRNVLYYFDAQAMLEAVKALYLRAAPGCLLVLSHSETLQSLDVPWRYLSPSVYGRPADGTVNATPVPSLARTHVDANPKKIRILVIEDSETMQKLVVRMLGKDPGFEVVAVSATVADALSKLAAHKPDVVTLDMNLDKETGLDFLNQVPTASRVPTVLVTALAREEAPLVLEALACGASEYVRKPTLSEIDAVAKELCEKIRAVARVDIGRSRSELITASPKPITANRSREQILQRRAPVDFIAIGASTGGTEALRVFLEALPPDIPPILVVQHIPPVFSRAFAERLDALFAFEVKEAAHGDVVKPGRVLIAPGGKQMRIARGPTGWIVALTEEPPVSGHCPSVDVLFESVARLAGARSAGVILTGMGRDGANGLMAMFNAGARTFAQDEKSCVVFGMPRVAIEIGAIECIASLTELPRKVWQVLPARRSA